MLSYVCAELNSADLNSKVNKNTIKTLNSEEWRSGSILNFNTITSHGLILFQKTAKNPTKLSVPSSLVKRKETTDPIFSIFFSEFEPPYTCHQLDCLMFKRRSSLKRKAQTPSTASQPSHLPSSPVSPSIRPNSNKANKLHNKVAQNSPALVANSAIKNVDAPQDTFRSVN